MKQLYLAIIFMALGYGALAQKANAIFKTQITEYRMCDAGCGGEIGDENATFYIYLRDNVNGSENSTGCVTKDGDNCFSWDMPDITLGPRTNNSDYFILRMWGWEDDGDRCNLNSGDDCDCKNRDNINVDYTAGAFPSNDVYTTQTDWNWCSGSSGWAIKYRYTWKYTGTNASITPTCTAQNATQATGRIRSQSVYLTSGVTYQFETSTGPDTYLRLYGTDGYTIVAYDDDSRGGLLSLFTYTPTTTGWYYIETAMYLSGNNRTPLTTAATLTYKIVEKTGASLTNYINAGAITCSAYSNTQNNTANTGFCNYIGQGSDDIYYRFTTAQNGYIDISHCSSDFDTYMHLLNSGGTSLAAVDDNGTLCTGNRASMRQLLNAGTYFVVSEGYSTNSGNVTTVIQAHTPTGGTISGTTPVCPSQSGVVYSISGVSAATNYVWSVPSGATITAGQGTSSITVTFGSTGGNVSCIPKNFGDLCVGSTVTFAVTMQSNSTAPTAIGGTNVICPGGNTVLTASGGTAGTGASFEWFAGSCSGTVIGTGASVTVSPSATTTYYVRRTGTCNTTGCISQAVTVNTQSTAPTAINGTTTICPGASTVLTASGGTDGTGASFEWFAGSCASTVIGTGASITVTPSATTTYFVRRNGTCNATGCISQVVTVNTQSTPPTAISGTTTICPGDQTVLTASGGTAGTGATFQWFEGSCATSVIGTGASVTVSPAATTTYFVRRTGTCNTTSCLSQSVTLSTQSTMPSIVGNDLVCPGNSTVLTISGGIAGTGSSYQWFAGSCGSTIIGTGSSITVSPTSATTYFVRRVGTCNTTGCSSKLVSITATNTWTGSVGSGGVGYWDVPGNWSCGYVPNHDQDVVVPSSAANQPIIRNKGTYGVAECNSIDIETGATLTIQSSGELRTND